MNNNTGCLSCFVSLITIGAFVGVIVSAVMFYISIVNFNGVELPATYWFICMACVVYLVLFFSIGKRSNHS